MNIIYFYDVINSIVPRGLTRTESVSRTSYFYLYKQCMPIPYNMEKNII